MALKHMPAHRPENIELAYDGYDPSWIIGTQADPLPHWSYGPYASAYDYRMHPEANHHQGLFNLYDPHRRIPPHSYYGRGGPAVIVPGPSGPVVVKAAKMTPVPSVTTVLHPHGRGHTLGTGHGYKNIIVLKIPDCCEGCEDKWKDRLTDVPGFKGVNVDRRHAGASLKATVFGDVDTHSVMRAVQKVQPRAEFW